METKTKKRGIDFESLPIEKKRILVLRDALRHLKAERIVPTEGIVLGFDGIRGKLHKNSNLQKHLKKEKQCQVCQRGALLFSMVYRTNNLMIESSDLRATIHGVGLSGIAGEDNKDDLYLREIFDVKQLQLMERAFEGTYHDPFDYWTNEPNQKSKLTQAEADAARDFYKEFPDARERFEAILRNAIANNGIFIP